MLLARHCDNPRSPVCHIPLRNRLGLPNLGNMSINHDRKPRLNAESAFSRSEVRALGLAVVLVVAVSIAASLVSAQTIDQVLHGRGVVAQAPNAPNG